MIERMRSAPRHRLSSPLRPPARPAKRGRVAAVATCAEDFAVDRVVALAVVALAVVALACLAGCARPPAGDELADAELIELFRALHEPVTRVYEVAVEEVGGSHAEPDRDALHDLLSASFAGELLTRQYVEHFAAVARQAQDGTSIDVVRVDYETIAVVGRTPEGVQVDVDWSVGGVVQHQAHRHARTNRYRAVYELAPTGDGWRIVDARLRDMERVRRLVNAGEGLPRGAGGLMSPLDLLRAGMGEELGQPGDPADDQAGEQEPRQP